MNKENNQSNTVQERKGNIGKLVNKKNKMVEIIPNKWETSINVKRIIRYLKDILNC